MSDREDEKHIDAIEPDTYMGLSQQYIKDKISDEEFTKRCNRLKRIPINTYVSISEKFMQGEISEDEFVERYKIG